MTNTCRFAAPSAYEVLDPELTQVNPAGSDWAVVTSPNGGEEWLANSTQQIRWEAGDVGNTVSIFYSDLYAGTNTVWIPIVQAYPNTQTYDWTVSDKVSPQARVKIQSDDDPNLFAISAQNFNISGVRVTYPNLSSDTLIMGQPAIMTHTGAPVRWLSVRLEISYNRAATWQMLGPGSDDWTLPQPFQFTPTFPSRQTKVRAIVLGATTPLGAPLTNVIDLSDEYFEVHGMVLEAPVGGSTNTLGTQSEILWISAGAATAASIYYSPHGTNFSLLVQGVFNNQTYPGRNPFSWKIPKTLLPSTNARIKIVAGSYEALTAPFTLRGIRITSPTNDAVLPVGSAQAVAWTNAGMNVTSRGTIALSLNGTNGPFTNLEDDYDLVSIPFYDWNIDPDLAPSINALIRLKVISSDDPADVGFTAVSDRFTLKGIKILSPAPGGAVQLGQTTSITFVSAAAGQTARIEYSADGGFTYDSVPIMHLEIGTGTTTFEWTVEATRTPSTNAVIRITGTADVKVSGVFTMSGIRVDSPMQHDTWSVDETNTIAWMAQVPEPVFNLDLLYPDGASLALVQNVAGSSHDYRLPLAALRGQEAISNVVLRVADRQGTAAGYSAPFRLVSQPVIGIVSPRAGDFLRVGEETQVIWSKGGSMRAEDFTAWFSLDAFATLPEDIGREVTFNAENNTFAMPWVVPDRLGRTRVMVTNSLNPTLASISGEFDIVGTFELVFPNGVPGEDDIHADQQVAVIWFTLGSVEHVNIFYNADEMGWVKDNKQPIFNHPDQGRYQSVYQWTAPVLQSDNVILRVQDAAYPDPNLFDGVQAGPYDQSDAPFALNSHREGLSKFFRIVSPTNTAISGMEPDGTISWTSSAVGVLATIQRATSLVDSGNWRDYVHHLGVSTTMTARIVDPNPPEHMVFIPGGVNAGTDPDDGAYSLTVSSFYMDKFEVTKALWDSVYTWAIAHGYSFDNAGSGKAANHPVHSISWFDVVKWCNARSQKEGRPAVYTVDGEVYKSEWYENVVQTSAAGYRLPTDVEWEYAARGGLQGWRFPWGNTIQHARANYYSDSSVSYDVSWTQGHHPTYITGELPYTSPVGSFAANGYGLYDMAGNVREWCYNSHSVFEGAEQVLLGGGWDDYSNYCRVASRDNVNPFHSRYDIGFRAVLPPDQ